MLQWQEVCSSTENIFTTDIQLLYPHKSAFYSLNSYHLRLVGSRACMYVKCKPIVIHNIAQFSSTGR